MIEIKDSILYDIRNSNKLLNVNEISEKFGLSRAITHKILKDCVDNGELTMIAVKKKTYFCTPEQEKDPYYFILDNPTTDFSSISTEEALISYLTDSSRRLENRPGKPCNLYHYTKLSTVINIIKSGFWYLGNPQNMNDGLEYCHADPKIWDNIFFSSFMIESKESLAMWSMYAQPWADGVMITIPSNEYKKWIRDVKLVYKADPITKSVDKDTFLTRENAKLFITNVAYCNTDSIVKGEKEVTTCGKAQNDILRGVAENEKLIGYVKNDAWSYEKEVRLRVDINNIVGFKGVSIKVPDYIIDSIIITKGPRFIGDLQERIKYEISMKLQTETSLFHNKFRYIPCDSCINSRNINNL